MWPIVRLVPPLRLEAIIPTPRADGSRNTGTILPGTQEFEMKTSFRQMLLAVAAMATVSSWTAAHGQYMQAQYYPGQPMPGQQAAYMGGGEYMGPEMYEGGYCGDCGGDCYGGCGDCGCGEMGCCDYGGCGQCGCNPCGCEQPCYGDACCGEKQTMCYLEIQNMFLRAHVNEEAVGKLSEQYEWTPRFVAGFELPSGIGARGRYFNYDEETTILDNGGDDELGLQFEVIDAEGTGRIRTTHADIILSGGFRWANIEITEDDDTIQCDAPGLTVAADGRTVLCRTCKCEWAGVAGARWSLLGGDWEGEDNDLVEETRDDNIVVNELYAGVEWVCCGGHCNWYARGVFEMQHWSSDALNENDATISFVGPGIHGGVTF
jgi:hypothetical protein